MSFDRIRNYPLPVEKEKGDNRPKKYLFFDIFVTNAVELVVISPYYIKEPVNLLYEGRELVLKSRHGDKSAQVYIYHLPEPRDDAYYIIVEYNRTFTAYRLDKNTSSNHKYTLCHTTLFKDDHYLLKRFVKYYERQGVEHFYMYYNGPLTDLLDRDEYKNVTFIEWNYEYYIDPKDGHAQSGQINHALYKYGKPSTEYMIYNDLDEYMFIANISLSTLLQQNPGYDTYMFLNVWCDTVDIPTDIEQYYESLKGEDMPERIAIKHEIYAPSHSSKCIHKSNSVYFIENIHCGEHYVDRRNIYRETVDTNTLLANNLLFHFFRWSRPHVDHSHRSREDVGGFDNYSIVDFTSIHFS
jgi:hypothetical protein